MGKYEQGLSALRALRVAAKDVAGRCDARVRVLRRAGCTADLVAERRGQSALIASIDAVGRPGFFPVEVTGAPTFSSFIRDELLRTGAVADFVNSAAPGKDSRA